MMWCAGTVPASYGLKDSWTRFTFLADFDNPGDSPNTGLTLSGNHLSGVISDTFTQRYKQPWTEETKYAAYSSTALL